MAKIRELEKKRAAQRRLALLVLAGEQPEPSGSCLDPEELAALVEGKLAPEQAELCLEHLAGCERCYALWRQLDREWQEQAEKSNRNSLRQLIKRPQFMAAAGSLLAAAASIAVFLTITTQADRPTLVRLPEQPAQEKALPASAAESANKLANEKDWPAPPAATGSSQAQRTEEQAAVPATPPTERRKSKGPAAPDRAESGLRDAIMPAQPSDMAIKREDREARAPAERAVPIAESTPASAEMMRDEKEQGAVSRPEKSEATPTAQQSALRGAGAPAPKPAPVAGTVSPLTLVDWHNRIREGCQGRPGPDFFAAILDQGEHLLRKSALLDKQERRQVERLLAVLDNQQPAEQQCQALLNILGPVPPGQER
jgi:hypothetical protein